MGFRVLYAFIFALGGCWVGAVQSASAQSEGVLTRANITYLKNQVQLMERESNPRPARLQDEMTPGDGLSTAAQSIAELQFNDASLARLGEQSIFWFTPQTRSFQLTSGTALLLISPGQGRTRVQTPSAVAGIEGSALFVRYLPETNETIIGALTNSNIVVCDAGGNQCSPLAAGELAAINSDRIQRFEFDLKTFYETSSLVEGLGLDELPQDLSQPNAAVRGETGTALAAQDFTAEASYDPTFIQLPSVDSDRFPTAIALPPLQENFSFEVRSDAVFNAGLDTVLANPTDAVGDTRNLSDVGEFRAFDEQLILRISPDNASIDGFPGRGGGVDGFPGQGGGVDGFPGQGGGVDGFPGQGDGVVDGFPDQAGGVDGLPDQAGGENGLPDQAGGANGLPDQVGGVDGFPVSP